MTTVAIDSLTSAALVAAFNNTLVAFPEGTEDLPAQVKKFSDKKTGVKRTAALVDRLVKVVVETDTNSVTAIQVTEAGDVNFVQPEPDLPVGPPAEALVVEAPPKEPVEAAPVAPRPAPSGKVGGRRPSVVDSDVLTLVLTEENPKRAAARLRFAKYKAGEGITFAEYIAAIGGDRKQALRDVIWDAKQGWITIAGVKRRANGSTPPAA